MPPPGTPPGWSHALQDVGTALTHKSDELGRRIMAVLAREIPEASSTESGLLPLLQQMVDSNIDNVITSCVHQVPLSQLQPTTASLHLARRLAERGIPAHRMVRIYQVGHRMLLRRMLEELSEALPGERTLIDDLRVFVDYNLSYLNAMSYAAVREYGLAEESWNSALGAAAAFRVDEVLHPDWHDDEAASAKLGYDVTATHVGLVLWSPRGTTTLRGLALIAGQLRSVPTVTDLLTVPRDVATLVCWVAVPQWPAQLAEVIENAIDSLGANARVACGEPLTGLGGFRETYEQALAARRVAELPGCSDVRVTRYWEVAVISLMATQPAAIETWVHGMLGELLRDDEEMARLRQTLRTYLTVGESTTATASRLDVHRNTVKYRVARAMELLPIPFEQNRLRIALALEFHDRATPVDG